MPNTKVLKFPSKLLFRKHIITLTFVDLVYKTSFSSWDFSNDDRNLMTDLLLFQLATRLNAQNIYEPRFIMKSDTLIYIWILVFPIGIIEVTTPRKWSFLLYISSLHDYWRPSTWNSLVHIKWGKMERCEKRALQLLKMRKKKIS